jgi:prepilin-type N-terminal cleavage/methylation domain-containing protein
MGHRCLKHAARALEGERGFTSTEVAIVLVLIGLLASIAVTAFAAQRDRAEAAEAKTVARTAEIAMETYYVEHRAYEGATVAELEEVQPALRGAPSLVVNEATTRGYELESSSTSTRPVTFVVARSPAGTLSRSCRPSDGGGCKNGIW